MRITLIGSSHGVPEPNRKCSCTLLEIGEKKYLIDAGTDPMAALVDRGIHPDSIRAVFITHRHGDHTNGLIPFVDLCSWYFKEADPEFYLPDMKLLDALKCWIEAVGDRLREDLRFRPVQEGVFFDDGTLRVTAMRNGHISDSYSFKLEAEGKTVLFTGDMKPGDGPSADYARFTQSDVFDLVVAESAHFNAMKYLEPIRANPPKRFCFNHYSTRFVESCWHLRKELENEVPVTLLTDGYEITL